MMPANKKKGHWSMARPTRHRGFGYRRILIRPCGLAGSPWEPVAAAVFALALVAVFAVEIATPDAVVGVLGLLPVLAALWTLSHRHAAVVCAIALVEYVLSVLEEPQSRLTFVCVGAVGAATSIGVRAYATSLAEILSPQRAHPFRTLEDIASTGGVAGLTRRQLEVARLASEGYMAAEIGDRLHISERTVETHLAHAYAKLGINSRPALIRISERLHERS